MGCFGTEEQQQRRLDGRDDALPALLCCCLVGRRHGPVVECSRTVSEAVVELYAPHLCIGMDVGTGYRQQ